MKAPRERRSDSNLGFRVRKTSEERGAGRGGNMSDIEKKKNAHRAVTWGERI